MKPEEAKKVIAQMKSGMGFSDETANLFWSYTYNAEEKLFVYIGTRTTTGELLTQREYQEPEFFNVLVKQFEYSTIKGQAFMRGHKPVKQNPKSKDKTEAKSKMVDAIINGDLQKLGMALKEVEDINAVLPTSSHCTALTLACTYGNPNIIEYLIRKGADVLRMDDRKKTTVELACEGFKTENIGIITTLLLEAGAKVPSHKKGEDGALHRAAMYGAFDAAKLLVEQGVNVNEHGSYGRTPLMYAAADGKNLELVNFLIEHGADLNAKNEGNDNALFDMVTRDSPSTEIAKRLIDAGLDINYVHPNYKTILGWAANCGKIDIVKLLLSYGANVNTQNDRNESPIAQAMMSGHHELVKLLFDSGADPESMNYGGWSLLEYAAEKKDEALVGAIIKRIESVQSKADSTKKSARDFKTESLIKAAEKGYISMMELLINHGANINGTGRWERETPIIKAAYYGQTKSVKWLLDHGANIEAHDSRGNTALNHASWTGKLDTVKLLIEEGADVNAVNKLNWNSLMQAALQGHHEIAKVLLERGAKTDFIDAEKGASAYYLAERSGSMQTLEVLKSFGAKPRAYHERKEGEPYINIIECEYCQYVPHSKDLSRGENMGDYQGLVSLFSQSTDVDRYATSTDTVFKCKLCGTYYWHYYYIDTEDDFISGPHIDQDLKRFNLERLHFALKEYNLPNELAEFVKRCPDIISAMKDSLQKDISKIPSNILPYFLETLADWYLLADNWEGLKSDLLLHQDKSLSLSVARDLIYIVGQGKNATVGPLPQKYYQRDITPNVYSHGESLLRKNRNEFMNIINSIAAMPEHSEAAHKVIESVQEYKI